MSERRLVHIDRRHVEDMLRKAGIVLDEAGYRRITARALNRAIVATRAEAVRLIRDEYNAPAGDLRRRMSITRATQSRLQASLRAKGDIFVPLIRYGARPAIPVSDGGSRPKAGVSVHVKRAEGRKVITGSFVQRAGSGGAQIFVRKRGARRFPIRMLYGPGQIQILRRDASDRRMQERAEEILERTALHEASAMLRGIR